MVSRGKPRGRTLGGKPGLARWEYKTNLPWEEREAAKKDGLEKRRAALKANPTDLRAQARRKRLCEQSKPDTIALAEGMSKLWEQRLQTTRARKGTPEYRMVDEILAEESAIRFAKIARDLRAPQREKERQQTALEQKKWLEATRAVRYMGKELRKKLRADQVELIARDLRAPQREKERQQTALEQKEWLEATRAARYAGKELRKKLRADQVELKQRGMTASQAVEPKTEPGEISLTQAAKKEAEEIQEETEAEAKKTAGGRPTFSGAPDMGGISSLIILFLILSAIFILIMKLTGH